MPPSTPSPFAALEITFRLLAASQPGLIHDGQPSGQSARTVPLPKRDGLGNVATPPGSLATTLDELARRARTGEPVAVVAYAGVLLPELRRRADQLTAEQPLLDPAEAEAMVLGRFKRDLGLTAPVAVPGRTAPRPATGWLASHGHAPGREHDAASA